MSWLALTAWLLSQAAASSSLSAGGATEVTQPSTAPATYRGVAVTFQSTGGITLAGTLSMPSGTGPFPAVVLLAGSGPNNRDELPVGPKGPIGRHPKFLVLAQALNDAGFAVLRYDKRGVGLSGGNLQTASFTDLTDDAAAAVHFLQTRPEVSKGRLGVIGDSEGGFIAPILAVRDPSIRFVVLLSTSALPFEQINLLQKASLARANGVDEKSIAADQAMYRRFFEIVRTARSPEEARQKLAKAAAPFVARGRMTNEQVALGIAGLTDPLGFELMRFSPQAYLAKLNVPVLTLNGSLDTQIPTRVNSSAMRLALRNATDKTVVELEGVNHQLQGALTGAPSEYDQIKETISPAALRILTEWLAARIIGTKALPSADSTR